MKSVLLSFLMFAVVLLAMYLRVFDFLASKYVMIFAAICLIAALLFALKVLGNPLNKDDTNEKK